MRPVASRRWVVHFAGDQRIKWALDEDLRWARRVMLPRSSIRSATWRTSSFWLPIRCADELPARRNWRRRPVISPNRVSSHRGSENVLRPEGNSGVKVGCPGTAAIRPRNEKQVSINSSYSRPSVSCSSQPSFPMADPSYSASPLPQSVSSEPAV